MKKVLLVLALVVAYGVSMSTANAKVVTAEKAKTVVVADMNDDNNVVAPEGEKEKKEKAEAKTTKSEAKGEGCATAKSEAKSEGCAGKSEAKAEGCAGKEKTASAEVTKTEKK